MRLLLAVATCAVLAGCIQAGPAPKAHSSTTPEASWSKPVLVDPVRSGGEPVLFVTAKGTLLIAAHPGFTHTKPPPGLEEITPASGQSYLFRSTDSGATWTAITGPAPNAPRNTATGESDPDLAESADGKTLAMADLQLTNGVSTSASVDDGASWPASQPFATDSQDSSVDRPWLAFAKDTFYLLYNGDGAGHWRVRASKDGVSWADHSTPGDGSYPGAMAAGADGSLYVGNGDKVWWSVDAGKTFASSKIPGTKPMQGIVAQRPSVDDAGTVYFAWSELHGVYYAASKDHGATWGARVLLSSTNGTTVWPWPVAGAAGKLGVVWLETSEKTEDPSAATGEWLVHAALVDGADSVTPTIRESAIPGAVATKGGICMDGTFCEAELKDRRLGDFITCAITKDGYLAVAYGTTETGHAISSPMFVRETEGMRVR